jgi:hypothetical protein
MKINKMSASILVGLLIVFPCHARQEPIEWLAVSDHDLTIKPDSALDFSALVENTPAGSHGRIIRGENGHLAYTDSPTKARRFFCASQPHGAGQHFPDHATADRYAKQIRLHGYNVARFHFVEHDLMTGQSNDFELNAEQLDRLHYFLAALKREGIYWLMDGMSAWNGLYGDVVKDHWQYKHNLKLGVYFDDDAKAHWQQIVAKVLNQVNPYTQQTPLQDPALLGVILVNEGGLNHLVNVPSVAHDDLSKVDRSFTQWLIAKYGSLAQAFSIWGEAPELENGIISRNNWNASLRVADTERFFYETQNSTLQWMTDYLHDLGYSGLISAYDNWTDLQDTASRHALDWVDMHAYQDEPSHWVSSGSALKQQSSLVDHLGYVRDLASNRYWFKPFTVSEYDQPFWDTSRYEAGLVVGAYGSFQNWDLICRHSGAIELSYGDKNDDTARKAIYPFDVGMDPIARAGETLAALLFARGDVKSALHKVSIRLTPDYIFKQQAGIGKLPEHLTNIALVTGLGLSWQEEQGKVNKVIQPNELAPSTVDKVVDKLKHWSGLSNYQWTQQLAALKEEAILAPDNASNDNGVFQSDTGEINLDSQQKILTVDTEKTEAVAFASILPPPLENLTITNASDPALFAASSLDGSDLAHSKRILLIYASDAKNSGMRFTNSSKQILKELGTLPVQLKNSSVSFSLNNTNAASLHLYALHLNGERGMEIPIDKSSANTLNATLDLGTISQAPTTYFELTSY